VILLTQEVRGGWLFPFFSPPPPPPPPPTPHKPNPKTHNKTSLLLPTSQISQPHYRNVNVLCVHVIVNIRSSLFRIYTLLNRRAFTADIKHFHYSSNPSPGWISRPTPQCTRICITTFARTRLIKSLRQERQSNALKPSQRLRGVRFQPQFTTTATPNPTSAVSRLATYFPSAANDYVPS